MTEPSTLDEALWMIRDTILTKRPSKAEKVAAIVALAYLAELARKGATH